MYSPTKHGGAYRREDDGSGGAGSGREAEIPSTAAELDQRCHARLCFGPKPGGTLLGEADCTGLDPEAVYVYGERVEGRARRPPQRASTVARNKAAHWKANQHRSAMPCDNMV